MKHLTATALLLFSLLPALGHGALLKYELEFTPWLWPHELIEQGVYPKGNGHLIADTELNAVVGGELKSNFFHFVWTDPTPSEITFVDTYYDQHVVNGGVAQGTDMLSGVNGSLTLDFLLPPGISNYSSALDQHFLEDIWCELTFPDNGAPASQWLHTYLGLQLVISSPTVVSGTPVSEPATFILLSMGLATIVGARARKTR